MNAHTSRLKARGFALIATISVLLLLTVLAVAFLSLSAITVRTSRIDWAQEEARANARLGLMVAIGELQRDLGPDQRIAITGAIMDSQPDTDTIDGVQNPHWTGVVSSVFEGNRNGSPFSRDMSERGLQDARNGTNFQIRSLVQNYIVSGNEGGPEKMAGGRRYLDAVTEPVPLSENTVEIVSLGSTIRPTDRVRVLKTNLSRPQITPEGVSQVRQSGAYSYWVSPNNQKAHLAPDIHRTVGIDHNNGTGMQRMLHPQDHDPFVMTGIRNGSRNRDERILTPKTLMVVDPGNRRGVLENFHALTDLSYSTLTNVRDGGLKKNLSAFLHGGDGSEAPTFRDLDSSRACYIGVSPVDRLIGPPNESYAQLRGEPFTDSEYDDVAPTFGLLWNWANLANEFQFGRASTGIRNQRIWNGAPFENGQANIYDGENQRPADPRNLTEVKITPVVTEACIYYNLASYRFSEGNDEDTREVLRLCLYPRVGLWNPYNVEMRLDRPMVLQLFLNGQKQVEFDNDPALRRQIHFGGRFANQVDTWLGGRVYLTLPAVTIPPGETFIFSIGGAPRELDVQQISGNQLQANSPPDSSSYLFRDYRNPAELLPGAPGTFRENPTDLARHGADNYMFMLKYLERNPQNATIQTYSSEPTLVYASVSLQAGGGDEYPIAWPVTAAHPVIRLNGPGDHVDSGIPPSPLTRDGFRIRWLDETQANKAGGNELFLQEAPLGNWNLRASYITRNPFDNVTSNPPYFHGIYTRDNPSDELDWNQISPRLQNGFQTGFPFGRANFGVDRVIAFELPTQEIGIPSLSYLRHLQLSEYVWHPSYAIGSSIADPRVAPDGTVPADMPGRDHGWSAPGLATSYWAQLFNDLVFYLPRRNHLIYDMSYEVNHNLFSDFFLTGARPNEIANFVQDPIGSPLKNGNFRIWDRSTDPTDDLNDFFRAAGRLIMQGGFDVHSTNREAWIALLSTTRDTLYGSQDRTAFPRTLTPKGLENSQAEYTQRVFTGFRSLGDQEIRSLADAIVREVKIRAPFFGLSDFVNRRLAQDDTSLNGTIEAALERSLPNRGQNQRFPIVRTELNDQGPLIAQRNPNQSDLTRLDQRRKPASTGYGTPGYITQGDVMQVIGSGLVARSDTFTIRAYGESKDVNGKVLARAWCEAVVQRTPEPVNPDGQTGMNPRILPEGETNFGRRFEMISFRWLHPDEV
jgi:type II secretory pathway pseudopilin PulG